MTISLAFFMYLLINKTVGRYDNHFSIYDLSLYIAVINFQYAFNRRNNFQIVPNWV